MKLNKWFIAMIASMIFTFIVVILEILGYIDETGFLLGIIGIELTMAFGLLGTTSYLDIRETLEKNTEILENHSKNQNRMIDLLGEIRDLFGKR